MKALHEGALATLFIVWKTPQDPHTAPQLACHPLNNERGITEGLKLKLQYFGHLM